MRTVDRTAQCGPLRAAAPFESFPSEPSLGWSPPRSATLRQHLEVILYPSSAGCAAGSAIASSIQLNDGADEDLYLDAILISSQKPTLFLKLKRDGSAAARAGQASAHELLFRRHTARVRPPRIQKYLQRPNDRRKFHNSSQVSFNM